MKKWISFFCIVILSFFAVKPLFSKGYFPMHDDTQVARVVVMGHALRDGQFPVRIVSDLGYGLGYPIFNFYGPLPYYVGGALYAMGLDSVTATKIMFGIGTVIAPFALFFLLSPVYGTAAALAGAAVFLFAPYHAVQIYVRGSVGEYWAIAFVPLVVSGFLLALRKKNQVRGVIIGGLALAAIITSHTILGFLTCGIFGLGTIVFWIVRSIQKKCTRNDIVSPVSIAVLGLLLSAFFWLPAFVEMSQTSVTLMVSNARTTFFDHFVCVSQLWNSPWGFAGSAQGCIDGMSFKLGKLPIMLAGVSVGVWLIMRKNKRMKDKNLFMGVAAGVLLLCIIGMIPQSAPFWNMISYYTKFIQYPWRLLTFGMLAIAICSAYLISAFKIPLVRICIALGIMIATIVVHAKIFVPQYQYERDSTAFESFEELRFIKSQISDEYLPPAVVKPNTAKDVVKTTLFGRSTFSVQRIVESSTSIIAEIESTSPQKITIHKAWFPGWTIFVNKKEMHPQIEQGFPSVNIEAGISIIEMRFSDTPVRTIGNWMSILGVLILGVIYIYGKKTNA